MTDLEAFWRSVWDYFDIESPTPPGATLAERTAPYTGGAAFDVVLEATGVPETINEALALLRSETFREAVNALPGYDARHAGRGDGVQIGGAVLDDAQLPGHGGPAVAFAAGGVAGHSPGCSPVSDAL